jgi:hypothetical protein
VALFQLTEPAEPLVAPALIAAFDGWADAAGASTTAASVIARDGRTIAVFDPDALYDYRSRRPALDIVDGIPSDLVWPELAVKHLRQEGRDLLVLTGPEPDLRWRELGVDILDVCLRLGIVEWMSLGSLPAAVPHTRPVRVLATASKAGLLHEDERLGPAGLLRVPAAALSTFELAVSTSGIPAVGFFAQVPHYVAGPYAEATIALLEHAGRHLGVTFSLGSLPDEAAALRRRLDEAVAGDEDSKAYVERLERMVGEERIPSGDEIAAEIERFLRGQSGPGDGGRTPLGG